MPTETSLIVKREGAGVQGALDEIREKFKGSLTRGGVTAVKHFPAREARLELLDLGRQLGAGGGQVAG